MARLLLSKTFSQSRPFFFFSRPLTAAQHCRARSTLSAHDGLIEVDLSSSSSDGESEALMIKKLDDIVQRIIVQRATPDWLPFLPGYSFWVPPRRDPVKVTDLVHRLTDQLGDDESLALSSDRGWPSAQFFLDTCNGSGHIGEVDAEGSGEAEVEMEAEVPSDSEDMHPLADKEG